MEELDQAVANILQYDTELGKSIVNRTQNKLIEPPAKRPGVFCFLDIHSKF